MKRILGVFLAALLMMAMACPAAWAKGNLKGEVQALLNQAAKALAQKDVEAAAALVTPDATLRYLNGSTMTIAQWKPMVAGELAKRQTMTARFQVNKAEAKRDRGVATYEEFYTYTLKAEPQHKYASKATWRVALRKTPQGWRFQEFQELSLAMTRDGKPYKPTPGPAGGS
ncbi:MAG: nuclear transport factor 2 family protein [Desulfarculus sp.]|nr:nuclear transport factor 2 family protein [Desulfarculus sp.]